ncbi:MAG: FtsX-like permease family protein, partial [Flavisolibacter sp.]
GAQSLNLSTVAPPFGPLLKNDFGEIENVTRVLPNGNTPLRYGEKMFNEPNTYFADEQFFDFFKVGMVKGNPKHALDEPFCVMMTEDMAKKYFGNEEPLNKVVRVNFGNYFDCKVTGVFKRFPSNTHFHPELIFSFNTLKDSLIYGANNLMTSYGNNSFFTYIRLPKGYNTSKMEAQFPAFIDRHMPQRGSAYKPSQGTKLSLQKLTDIHLRSHTDYEAEENGDIKRVYIFSAIGLFILLIACINYMNLSTARSTLRAREIGIRKVSGAEKKEIMFQFLSESVMFTWIAAILAVVLTLLILPGLKKLSGQDLDFNVLLRWNILIPLLLVPFIVGILSGLYPARFMASFKPVIVLKGFLKSSSGVNFRKVLVTFQFAISIILVICTLIVFQQMRYMQNKSLGFDKEHIINIPYATALNDKYEAFRTELLSHPDIKNAARSSRIPTGRLLDASNARIASGDTLAPVMSDIKYLFTDDEFNKTYGVRMAAGRDFSKDFTTDTSSFIINEAAAGVLGFKSPSEAIGKNFGYDSRNGKIIGVMNDFHFESMHEKIVPLVMWIPVSPNAFNGISIKMSGAHLPSTLAFVEKTWKKFLPETPYQFTFLDDSFAKLYNTELLQRKLFTVFACLAIFIACLGLLGLSAFSISQRIKEIGIRKILGANVSSIVTLISKDFLKLVGLAAVFAFPIAWYAMHKWLEDFAYRISIPWWVFLAAGIIAAVIAFVTIGFQAVRAAVANPVKNLRTE